MWVCEGGWVGVCESDTYIVHNRVSQKVFVKNTGILFFHSFHETRLVLKQLEASTGVVCGLSVGFLKGVSARVCGELCVGM